MTGSEPALSAEDAALVALREEAAILPDVIDHEGDCAGSLCSACGHCLHSIADCECQACGCRDYVESDEGNFRRHVIAVIDALTDERRLAGEREGLVWSAGFAEGVKYAEDRGWHLSDTDRAERAAALDADGRTGADQGDGGEASK